MHTRWDLIVRGLGAEETVIENLWVVVDAASSLAYGCVAFCPVGGPSGTRRGADARLELDTRRARCDFTEDGQPLAARYYAVRRGEYEIFEVLITAGPGRYEFHLEMDVVSGGKADSIVIKDREFVLAVPGEGWALTWLEHEGAWQRVPLILS